jgi:effector-binding domain-containing protein
VEHLFRIRETNLSQSEGALLMSRRPNFAVLLSVTVLAWFAAAMSFAQQKDAPGAAAAATAQPTAPAAGDPQPPAQPGADDDFVISRMRIQDFPAVTYFYYPTETTIAQLATVIPPIMEQMGKLIEEQKVKPQAAPVFVHKGATQDHSKPFHMEIGIPAAEGAQGHEEWKVRQLEAFHCATVIFSGPVARIGQAYQELFTQVFAAGLQPTGETREMHLHWEGPESPNNVSIIMVGVSK